MYKKAAERRSQKRWDDGWLALGLKRRRSVVENENDLEVTNELFGMLGGQSVDEVGWDGWMGIDMQSLKHGGFVLHPIKIENIETIKVFKLIFR